MIWRRSSRGRWRRKQRRCGDRGLYRRTALETEAMLRFLKMMLFPVVAVVVMSVVLFVVFYRALCLERGRVEIQSGLVRLCDKCYCDRYRLSSPHHVDCDEAISFQRGVGDSAGHWAR